MFLALLSSDLDRKHMNQRINKRKEKEYLHIYNKLCELIIVDWLNQINYLRPLRRTLDCSRVLLVSP